MDENYQRERELSETGGCLKLLVSHDFQVKL
jgi:hypothetical protein